MLAILGLLMSLVGPRVLNQLGGAKTKTAAIQIKDLEQALEMYKLDVGRFPSTSEGLKALVTPSRRAPRAGTAPISSLMSHGPVEARVPI